MDLSRLRAGMDERGRGGEIGWLRRKFAAATGPRQANARDVVDGVPVCACVSVWCVWYVSRKALALWLTLLGLG